ncbi:hypothetical protein EV200_101389 [Pedobacter psychrotolerans]|uniref:Uncharacterized protein n=1 Tax=Pedobacter psychrotolerans TaxID=1843235 RepID=A0A4R2HLM2_9SPHI|nr:hypothetical protein [Pedobacter psychrotolerans]TCO30948.1 hypothetical protein EV200_101389 [Pedobacter psychrotolerans]GGE43351.1 hypothetical protein GCM10011413_06630 [Pedobacter psychrotolerans]
MGIILIYWFGVAVLFVVGVILVIVKSVKNEPLKPGLMLILVSVIMLVIGAGACAVILSNLNIRN